MNEREAAEKLAALINEIQAAGHQVAINEVLPGRFLLEIGDTYGVLEPVFADTAWEVVGE